MRRRRFIQHLSAGAALLAGVPLLSMRRKPLRFGIVTDLHYAEKEPAINRYYRQSAQKLQDAVDTFNKEHLDFIIELGDLKDMNDTKDETLTLGFLDTIESVLQNFNGPVYHVLGNHDMDCISKQDFLRHTSNPGRTNGRSYYSFRKKGIKFIVLDGNFNEDMSPYCKGNFEWQKAFIPPEEVEWLREELRKGHEPVIIFCHQLTDRFSGVDKSVCLGNANDIVPILERNQRVLAVIQGHHHSGHYSNRAGIHYWTMKAMIESEYPTHNSYAIVEVDPRGDITITGYADCESRQLKE